MGRINRTTTGNIYIFLSIGLLLLVQVTPIYPNELLRYKDCTNKTTDHQFNSDGILSRVEGNLSTKRAYENDENAKDDAKLLTMRGRGQVGTDEQTHYDEGQWKTFPLKNKKSLSLRKYFNNPKYNQAPSRQIDDESRIVFPDNDELYPTSRLIPPTCDGSALCENVPNYPIKLIEKQLSERKYLKYLEVQDDLGEITNRIGESEDDPLCATRETVIYPQAAQTPDDDYKYIVNSENFRQGVRVELCMNHNTPCRLVDGFASGYKTACIQKYTYRQLLGMNHNGELTTYYFRMPASCCCHVQFVGNTWERMAKGRPIHSGDSIDSQKSIDT